jgi:hypothetical protein
VSNFFKMSEEQLMVFKKPSYPINPTFLDYLERFDRVSKVPIFMMIYCGSQVQ